MRSLGYFHAFLLCTAGVDGLFQPMLSTTGVDGLEGLFQLIHTSGRQQESMKIPKAEHTVL
jgi:hypothetical protein